MRKFVAAALACALVALGGCASSSGASGAASGSAQASGSSSAPAEASEPSSGVFDNITDTAAEVEADAASRASEPAADADASAAAEPSASGEAPDASADEPSEDVQEPADDPAEDASEVADDPAEGQAAAQQDSGQVLLSDFAVISQYPELPNGCEVTTLAAVLNYQGVYADKGVLSDDFLPKAPVGEANFYREFVGNPRDADAYGCYAPVIVATAQSYLAAAASGLSVSNLTGTPLRDLFAYVDAGTPVILWATQYNQQGHYSVTWTVDGQDLTWFTPEHCMALVGYDLDQGTVTVADPMTGGLESYDLYTFESNYNDLGQQAIVIQ